MASKLIFAKRFVRLLSHMRERIEVRERAGRFFMLEEANHYAR